MLDSAALVLLVVFIGIVLFFVRNPWILQALHEFGNHYNSAYIDEDIDEDVSRDLEDFSYLVGLVYFDEDMKMCYITTRLHVEASKNIVAYRQRVINGVPEDEEKDGAINAFVVEKMIGFYGKEGRHRKIYSPKKEGGGKKML
jgi:hypothetical protein